jgi:hypothetical protein
VRRQFEACSRGLWEVLIGTLHADDGDQTIENIAKRSRQSPDRRSVTEASLCI